MGNSSSRNPELEKLQKRFSSEEFQELEHLFFSLAAQSRTGGEHIIASVFQAFFGIHGSLGSRLFDHIARSDNDELMSFEEFLEAKAVSDKGSDEELDSFTFALADLLRTGCITRLEAEHVVSSALATVLGPEKYPLQDEAIEAFVLSAAFSGPPSASDIHPLCSSCRLFQQEREAGRSQGAEPSSSGTGGPQAKTGEAIGNGSGGEQGGVGESARDGDRIGALPGKVESQVAVESSSGCTRNRPPSSNSSELGSAMTIKPGIPDDVRVFDRLDHGDEVERVGSEPEAGRQTINGAREGGEEGASAIDCTEQCTRDSRKCGRLPCMTERDFRAWLDRVPSLKKFLRSLLLHPSTARCTSGRFVPELEWPARSSSSRVSLFQAGGRSFRQGGSILMCRELAWHLSGMLQGKEAEGPWRMHFTSSVHGLSFTTFMAKASDIPLPGIVIIRDKQGAVFGAVFSQALQRRSNFYGDMKTFLFTFYPAAAIYKPSGLNQNIQWCATGYASESIPNGVGFGGQIGHFGLFLDPTLDKGHSWPCLTFRSPALASSPSFDVDAVECWSIGQPSEEDEQQDPKRKLKGTVLERFKEEKALLGFAGVATSSDNLSKEEPPQE